MGNYWNKSIKSPYKVVMIRHGQSEMNDQNRFTGWIDSKLTVKGIQQAQTAGATLKQNECKFDVAYCSVLERSEHTLKIILEILGQLHSVSIIKHWRLNERHYGNATGMGKLECIKQHGTEIVDKWCVSLENTPPVILETNIWYQIIMNDEKYKDLDKNQIPLTESFQMSTERVLPYWFDVICPTIKSGKRVLICSHSNILKGIVMYLDQLTKEQIAKLDIPNAIPFYYQLDLNLKPYHGRRMKYI